MKSPFRIGTVKNASLARGKDKRGNQIETEEYHRNRADSNSSLHCEYQD